MKPGSIKSYKIIDNPYKINYYEKSTLIMIFVFFEREWFISLKSYERMDVTTFLSSKSIQKSL